MNNCINFSYYLLKSDADTIIKDKHHLKAKREKNLILQAKLNAITLNSVALEIYQNLKRLNTTRNRLKHQWSYLT
ncbi:MAG: hypothetical protein U9O86_10950 [Campylobacterota bacterium]|nr:hypothetical protein [Campylobacterota bacterium]